MIRPANGSLADTRTEAALCDLYRNSSYEFSRIRFEVHSGTILLTGRVPCYFLKQMAQELILTSDDVDFSSIDNRIDVEGMGYHRN